MPHTLIISDLHLSEAHPYSTALFERFMQETAPAAEALYILGDLFEYWAGDDDLDTPFHRHITGLMHTLTQQGVRLGIMRGNRDFLMDQALASTCNATLMSDPTLLDLYGTPTLLTHGDELCTDDVEYQRFRSMVRNVEWQKQFQAQPLAARKALIQQVRNQSEAGKQAKAAYIMDVNADAVAALLRQHHYPRLIHGHTHRPATHEHTVDGHRCERWVLGDWDKQANALRCDRSGIEWNTLAG